MAIQSAKSMGDKQEMGHRGWRLGKKAAPGMIAPILTPVSKR
jgi:hypothetical protein